MTQISKEMFEDIVAFSFSEPGAMGPRNMTFYKKTGANFSVEYLSDHVSYSLLKEYFPVLCDCYWNGPMCSESASVLTIVIGVSPDDKETKVAKGWSHIYLDFGNHLSVKDEFFDTVQGILKGKDNCDITFCWPQMLDDATFSSTIAKYEMK